MDSTPPAESPEITQDSHTNKEIEETSRRFARIVSHGSFEPSRHFYPRVLNATIHPVPLQFFHLSNERMIKRYCHMNPNVDANELRRLLNYAPSTLQWAGCDLFNVTTATGVRRMVVIETNTCPSGQKSMPLLQEMDENGGYKILLEHTFSELMQPNPQVPNGALAVIYDKNFMEASGYAASLADFSGEQVYIAELYYRDPDPPARWDNGILNVRDESGEWHPIRAAFRYVTQKPWKCIPLSTLTRVLNPVAACLAGGRNKMLASKAYDFYNADIADSGLTIRTPETIRDVTKREIPLWVESFGGKAVVKVPYSNAGQGVYTITSTKELEDFMALDHEYDKYIVQSLIGNAEWSSSTKVGQFYHVGTVPNRKNEIFVADLRMMVAASRTKGFRPIALYGRKAHYPLADNLVEGVSGYSWGMLGTNLSVKKAEGSLGGHAMWDTETERLMLMDRKDFNVLGLSIDDLIDGYVQTVLSAIAIDRMCDRLVTGTERAFDLQLFRSLNDDESLVHEIEAAQSNGFCAGIGDEDESKDDDDE